jgi:Tfp pilus assembly protein PilN
MKAVNLLPNDQRSVPKAKPAGAPKSAPTGSAFGAFMVLGAMAFAVVAVAASVLAGNTIKEREAELARVKTDVQAVQSQLSALKPYADFQTIAAQRVATVTQLAQGRFDWEQALRDLSRAMPRDVRLKSLRGSVSSGAGGGGGSSLRSAVQSPAIELSGCTQSQSDVARLMSRLRAVRGVTRVSLSKSEKPAPVAGGAGVVAGMTDEQGALCGKGRPPAFEVVVFFERSAALATTGTPGAPVTAPAGQASANGATAANGTTTNGTTSPAGQSASNGQSAPSTTGVSAP